MNSPFKIPPQPTVTIHHSDQRFPVHRIYCVARNYAAHAVEMGMNPDREAPFFFSKPADAVVTNGATIPYPPRTANLQHEIELVVAIGTGGRDIKLDKAEDHIFGYAVGNDLTRRDLQFEAREQGRPWDTSKGFDNSAPISAIHQVVEIGHIRSGEIWLQVNGGLRQQARIDDMIWSVPEIISELSTLFELQLGDLIFTGTPAGVSAVESGDKIVGYIAGLEELTTSIA